MYYIQLYTNCSDEMEINLRYTTWNTCMWPYICTAICKYISRVILVCNTNVYKLDAYADRRQYASRVPFPCGLTVVYEISPPLNLASRDITRIINQQLKHIYMLGNVHLIWTGRGLLFFWMKKFCQRWIFFFCLWHGQKKILKALYAWKNLDCNAKS